MCLLSFLQATVSKYGSQFRGNSQHDALEFLLWLLDRVHEDVILASHNNNNKTKAPGKVGLKQLACMQLISKIYIDTLIHMYSWK